MTRRSRRLPVLVTSAAAAVLALSSCGGGAPGSVTPEADEVYLPTATPTGGPTAALDPPADYATVEGDGFEISAPGEFRQERTTSSNGEPMLLLDVPSQVSAVPQRVAVIRDVDPVASAAEQSFALETSKGRGPEGEATRVQLPTEEGQAAFLVQWREVRPSQGEASVEVTYWQLMHQVGDDLILDVVAFAPTDEFATSEVSRILRTFVPTADAP